MGGSDHEEYRGCVPVISVDTSVDGTNVVRTQLIQALLDNHDAQVEGTGTSLLIEQMVIDLGCRESCTGATFVYPDRSKCIADLIVQPMPFDELTGFGDSQQ